MFVGGARANVQSRSGQYRSVWSWHASRISIDRSTDRGHVICELVTWSMGVCVDERFMSSAVARCMLQQP